MDCVAPSVALGLAFGRIGCFLAGCCWGDVCVDKEHLLSMKDPAALKRIHTIPAISTAGWPLAVQFPERSSIYKQHSRLGLVTEANSQSLPVHPVQLYEAALAAILCMYLCSRHRLLRRAGNVSLGLLIGYGLIRFATEFLRADNKVYAFGLTFSQVVSVWILLGSTIVISIRSLLAAKTSGEPAAIGEVQLASTDGSGNTNSI